MRGQYRIVLEIMLFGIGVGITSYVVASFSQLQRTVEGSAVQDQLTAVANAVSTAIVRSVEENRTLFLSIPDKLSEKIYRITFQDDNRNACGGTGECYVVVSFPEEGGEVRKKIFNIGSSHIITGDVVSTAGRLEIVSETALSGTSKIDVRRAS